MNKYLKLYTLLSICCWLALTALDLLATFQVLDFGVNPAISDVFFILFALFTFLSFRSQVDQMSDLSFIDFLWKVFLIGAVTVGTSLAIKFFFEVTQNTFKPFVNLAYHINIGLVTVFAAKTFYVWKRMILFQKTNNLLTTWNIYEYAVLATTLLSFFQFTNFQTEYQMLLLAPFGVLMIYLSFNLKWVAYLNYKQKWTSIMLIVLILVIDSTFASYLFELSQDNSSGKVELVLDLLDNTFIIIVLSFIMIYCFSSFLVILFNLPTSSVFEQKFEEVLSFQKLGESIQMGKDENEIHDIIVDSSMSSVLADAAWLEIFENDGYYKAFANKNIENIDIFEIKKTLRKNDVKVIYDAQYIRNLKRLKHGEKIKEVPYNSVLLVPLRSQNNLLGMLCLLKKVEDGFDKEMIDIIKTFVNQASVSLENYRLVSQALENERYKEELKIAKSVQEKLLPNELFENNQVETSLYTQSADDVGGDFFDYYEVEPGQFVVAIGDVSGHGTTAAFNMAQMKGVFHSLVHLNLEPDQFMLHANQALSKCLEKKSFITLSYFSIDTKKKLIKFSRAGHCPTLYYSHKKRKAQFFENKGMALGMVRSGNFSTHIEAKEHKFEKGDVMILYTDGILEARNDAGEEYGFERLKTFIEQHNDLYAKQIRDKLKETFYEYCGNSVIDDDYTFLIVKFV